MIFFSNIPIGWSENNLREEDLLEEKSAYGYPPPSLPPCPRMGGLGLGGGYNSEIFILD